MADSCLSARSSSAMAWDFSLSELTRSTSKRRFGRSKPATWTTGSRSWRRRGVSSRTRGAGGGGGAAPGGGPLVADALAAAGWHDGKGIAAVEDGGDALGLAGAELAIAEDVAEDAASGGGVGGLGAGGGA